ncbi:hypothetical protein EI94DRAFT_1786854 [Lactarius quietus]|nr:hypothetical protein EI94DRAFT_1786854 [Lactarius quietus]
MPVNVVPSSAAPDGPSLIVRLYDATKAVKIHKARLGNLARQCGDLLSTVRDHSPRLVGTPAGAEADEIERAIERILNRVLVWVGYNDRTAFFKQNEIQLGIDECYRELSACSNRFAIALSLVDKSENRVREEARQRDHKQLCDLLAGFLTAFVEEGRQSGRSMVSEPLALLSPPLMNQDSQDGGTAEAQGGANQVATSPRRTSDLSGRVAVVSDHAVIEGRFLDFRLGEWTNDSAPAALGCPRDQSPTSQMRFKEKVESWHDLQHRNVLRFFGHVKIDDTVYSVSPWMENGNIRDYVRVNPDADRMRLLGEVASGMEFLHENGIVHGDLCGKNVLIGGDGKAFICGFNLAEFENLTSDLSRHRWLAPERMTAAGVTSPTFKADVWSFGLLCLEVFTDADPYSTYQDFYVPVLLSQGKPPENPGTAAVGLSPKMWELMQSCWEVDPAARPDMLKIQQAMRDILPRAEPRATGIARRPSTSPAQNQPSLPTLVPPTVEGGSSHETSRSSSESSSVQVPLTPPPINGGLQLTLEPNPTIPSPLLSRLAELETTGMLRKGSNASSLTSARLPPLREDDYETHNPEVPILSPPPRLRSSTSSSQPSTAPSSSPRPSLASDLQGHASVKSSPPQSPTSASELTPPTRRLSRWFPKRSHTSASGKGDPATDAAKPPKPKPSRSPRVRSQTDPVVTPNVVPSRSTSSLLPLITPIRQRVPVSDEVLRSLSKAASDPENFLRLAKDGTVLAGNLEGLLSRVIVGSADPSRDERFRAAFLTIYQLFATSERVFEILQRRFEATSRDASMASSRYSILLFIESWLKKGFEDPDHNCSSKIREFARSVTGSQTMEEKAREIASLVDSPDHVRRCNPESCPVLRREPAPRPPGVTPSDVANAFTVIEGKRFERITYWDYVNFIRQRPNTRRLDVFDAVHELLKTWVRRTVLGFDYVDERMKKYEFWIYTAQACRKQHNFSSTSAIVTTLLSPAISNLTLTCDNKTAKQVLHGLAKDLSDVSYRNVIHNTGTKQLIPWLDPHLTSLNSTFVHSNPIMEVDGHPLIDFKLLSELAGQVNTIVQYTPPPIEHAARQDVLDYVEHSLKLSSSGDASPTSMNDLSAKRAQEESKMLETRERLKLFTRSYLLVLVQPTTDSSLSPSYEPATHRREISGVRGGVQIVSSLIQAARNVKIYQSQCNELGRRCQDLVSALQDHSPGLEGTHAQQAVDEVERVLSRILKRVARWAEFGKMKSFVKQTEIKNELEDSYHELQTCSMRFNIALNLNASSQSQELEEIRRHDHNELIEMIARVLQDNNPLKIALASSTPEDARSVVQAIEQELSKADFEETQERELQEDFSELRRWVEKLPPMVDLTGKVSRTSDHPIATGGSQDIYTGEWTGQEVALAYPRNQTRAAQERFQRQVEIWRSLRHPNVLQLLGIAYIDNFVFSVSPYMEFGNIMQYLKARPEAPRIRLLSEIASATEYLHSRGIIHGDLRGSNVLLSRDGHACLSDFGCARIEEVEATEALTYGSPRWLAPELMTQSHYVPTTRSTDVWSFGMLCVEIFTDNLPFSHIQNDTYVPIVIRDGELPTRPEEDITTPGLPDAMWELMNRCWRREPESRPKMPEIREAIQYMLPTRSASQRTSSSFGGTYQGGTRQSLLSASRPAYRTGLTPPSAPPSLPIIDTGGEDPLSEQFQRALSPSLQRSRIFNDMPLSSSPPSSGPMKPVPSPPNPSPLSSSLNSAQLHSPTTPESLRNPPPSGPQADWSERSSPSLYSQNSSSSSSSSNEASLLLEQLHITPLSNPDDAGRPSRVGSTSTGSGRTDTDPAPSLLDAAIRDTQPLLRRAADGTVEAGTLEGLVDRLVTGTHDHAKDNEVQRVFIATYRLFTTGEDLFGILKRRFDEIRDPLHFSYIRGSIRYPIALFLRTWLSTEGEHMDLELLSSIGAFASTVRGSDTMKDIAREIVDLVGENMDTVVASPISPLQTGSGHSPGSPPSPDQFKAPDIALSLTVIEGERYAAITQVDYVVHLTGAVSKHIESATKVNNRIVNWVKKKILGPEDVNKRAMNFRLFVLVAEECRKLQNFSSMSTIISALQSATMASSTTSQLVLTRENRLNKSEKHILRQLEVLLDPQGDHQAYREALKSIKSPFVVPWLAVHLRSLQASYDRKSDVVIVDQRPLINFNRCTHLLQRIEEVQRYHAPAAGDLLEKHNHQRKHRRNSSSGDGMSGCAGSGAAALAWVKAELENTPSNISREKFEARVRELAVKERRMRETHEIELRSLGFSTVSRQGTGTRGPSARSPSARMASLDVNRQSWI